MRFFSRRGNGGGASSSQVGQQQPVVNVSNGNVTNNGRQRHVYPGQRTVVRGNAVPRTAAVAGTAINAATAGVGGGAMPVVIRSAPAGSAPTVINAATYPGHVQPHPLQQQGGGMTQHTHTVQAGAGAGAGQHHQQQSSGSTATVTTQRTTVRYPPGVTPAPAPGSASASQGTAGAPTGAAQPQRQQITVDAQGRRTVRYTQHVPAPGAGGAGAGGSAGAAAASHHQQQTQHLQLQAQHHRVHQHQQQQPQPQPQQHAPQQQQQSQPHHYQQQQQQQQQRSNLMGAAGHISPGTAPTAAGGGLIQSGLNPSAGAGAGAGLGGSAPPGLGGGGAAGGNHPMTQQHYHPREHPVPPGGGPASSAGAGGAGTGAGAGAGTGAGGAGGGGSGGAGAPQAQTLSGPGAYSISRNDAGPTQVFRVTVPPGVAPNQEFQVYAGSRVVRVRCPPDTRPGQSLQITVPPDPVVRQNLMGMAVLTSVGTEEGGGAVLMRAEVTARNADVMREERERQERRDQETRDRATGVVSSTSSDNGRRGSAESGGDDDGDGADDGGAPATTDSDAEQDDDRGPNPAAEDSSPQMSSQQHMQQQQAPPPPPPPQPQAYMVTVPPGVRPGGHFPVMVAGQRLMVQCPHNARPGMNVRIVPPAAQQSPGAQNSTNLDRPPDQGSAGSGAEGPPRPQLTTQMFEVIVPAGVRPNQPFALIAGGQRVLVTCPPNAYPGQKIRFQLPVSQPSAKSIESVKLNYENAQDGWIRTVRVTDMKFQWVRMDERGDVDTDVRFDMRHSAYVRKLVFLEGNDARMRTGYLSLVPASEAAVDSRVTTGEGGGSSSREIVGYADLAAAQGRRYEDKARWFQEVCARLTTDWNEGHMRINVRRPYLLQDSMSAVMSLGRDDLRKIWRFEFMGEAGIDAGGLAREWFHLVTEQIFDPDNGLWMSSSGSQQMYMRINPASEISCPEDHLVYFRFLGRVMGKALFDRQLVSGHMVRHMYKHLLGWPISFDDLELFDEEYYQQLKKLAEYDDISVMCLSFVVTEDALGIKKDVDLIPGGGDVDVTNDNLPEYLEANLKYRMLDRIRPQLTELLLGFFDVIPEPLLTIFDYQELELLMCGLPSIDVDDWMAHTNYTGTFEGTSANGPSASHLPKAARWFWESVRDEFDQETRARLLQFVTGTSGVPSRGFSVLQGNDGNIRKFTVHGVDPAHYPYPRAHTCFNRIDLPMYTTKEELLEKLRVAVSTSATGFDIE